MALDDMKERIVSQAKQMWDRVQETSLYNNIMDRYQNLSPVNQKVVLGGSIALIAMGILSFPYSSFISSLDTQQSFEAKRQLTREVLKTAREASNIPQIAPPPPVDQLQSSIQEQLQRANLIPEQIRGVNTIQADTKLIPKQLLSYGLEVSLAKLTLNQVIDIGYQLSTQGMDRGLTVKMTNLELKANESDHRYLDAIFHLVSLKVPSFEPIFPPEEPKNKKGGSKLKVRQPRESEDGEPKVTE